LQRDPLGSEVLFRCQFEELAIAIYAHPLTLLRFWTAHQRNFTHFPQNKNVGGRRRQTRSLVNATLK
jgi:hypothetical protein